MQRAAGGRYPNSCREKLKGAIACWESRSTALRTPWSMASSSTGVLAGSQRNCGSWQPCQGAVGENVNWSFWVKVWGPNMSWRGGVTTDEELFRHRKGETVWEEETHAQDPPCKVRDERHQHSGISQCPGQLEPGLLAFEMTTDPGSTYCSFSRLPHTSTLASGQ